MCCIVLSQAYEHEMAIVTRRLEWLSSVVTDDEARLQMLIKQTTAPPAPEDGQSVTAGSRDLGALSRAGPCHQYEQLTTLSSLAEIQSQFRLCTSAQEVKDTFAKAVPLKKTITLLQTACKASMSELKAARARDQAAVEAEQKREAKKKKDQEKGKPAKPKPAGRPEKPQHIKHAIFAFQSRVDTVVDTASTWQDHWDLESPFLLSGFLRSGFEKHKEELQAELDDFSKAFDGSSVKAHASVSCSLHMSCRLRKSGVAVPAVWQLRCMP